MNFGEASAKSREIAEIDYWVFSLGSAAESPGEVQGYFPAPNMTEEQVAPNTEQVFSPLFLSSFVQ
jgi:hypothetical protein